ncbi:hypothetical protein BDZ91DRAFT_852884, partial [Kalaharituber pfeilii]
MVNHIPLPNSYARPGTRQSLPPPPPFLESLPMELLIQILGYLEPRDVGSLRRVNRAQHEVFTREAVCAEAVSVFFGSGFLYSAGVGVSARELFDRICQRRASFRRRRATSATVLAPDVKASTIATDPALLITATRTKIEIRPLARDHMRSISKPRAAAARTIDFR